MLPALGLTFTKEAAIGSQFFLGTVTLTVTLPLEVTAESQSQALPRCKEEGEERQRH